MSLSSGELEAVRERLDAATPGPWKSFAEGRDPPGLGYDSFIRTAGEDIYLTGATIADRDFIAHARQDVQALLGEVARLTADRPA